MISLVVSLSNHKQDRLVQHFPGKRVAALRMIQPIGYGSSPEKKAVRVSISSAPQITVPRGGSDQSQHVGSWYSVGGDRGILLVFLAGNVPASGLGFSLETS